MGEEFQKYLEKAGVIDQLTKLLVSLYENPDRPENALDYIRNFLGANIAQNANDDSKELQQRISDLEQQLKEKYDEINQLKQQLNAQNKDDNNNYFANLTDIFFVCFNHHFKNRSFSLVSISIYIKFFFLEYHDSFNFLILYAYK